MGRRKSGETAPKRFRQWRGFSLLEGILSALLLSFLVLATASLLHVGERQMLLGRSYSQVQTDLREALRRATRGVRHGYAVVGTSTKTNFSSAPSSSTSQLIVDLPQSGGSRLEARYHLTGGTLYLQTENESPPGTPLITGVQTLGFTYYQTLGAVRSQTDGIPANATEVLVRLVAIRGSARTEVQTLITLRNRQAGVPG